MEYCKKLLSVNELQWNEKGTIHTYKGTKHTYIQCIHTIHTYNTCIQYIHTLHKYNTYSFHSLFEGVDSWDIEVSWTTILGFESSLKEEGVGRPVCTSFFSGITDSTPDSYRKMVTK